MSTVPSDDPTTGPGALVERAPRRVRPPHHTPDEAFDHLMTSDVEAWRRARHLDRCVALHEPLAGLPLSDYEARILAHRAGDDVPEVAVLVALLHRCRAAAPLAATPGATS